MNIEQLKSELLYSLKAEASYQEQIDTQRAMAADPELTWQARESHHLAMIKLRMQLDGQRNESLHLMMQLEDAKDDVQEHQAMFARVIGGAA